MLVDPISQNQETCGVTRRGFFVNTICIIWASILAALGIPAFAYLFVPPKARKNAEWVDAGDISGLSPNEPVERAFRLNRIDGWKIASEKMAAWVVRRPGGEVVAFGPQCTHLGCAYHWEDGRNEFVCPCHNSTFGIDGKVLSGPAPRPLDRYQTRLDGNKLLIGPMVRSKETSA